MTREPLTRAPQPKGTTLCPTWFFGGPHQWNSRDRCTMCGITRAEVSEQIIAAERALDEAYAVSTLPERPNTEAVEGWMLKTYSVYWVTGHA